MLLIKGDQLSTYFGLHLLVPHTCRQGGAMLLAESRRRIQVWRMAVKPHYWLRALSLYA